MNVVAVMMVRDEEDILPYTLPHLLSQVDHAIIADNRSVDSTPDILRSFDRVTVVDDPDPRYLQSEKMTDLAHRAGAMGARWIVPVDADEVLYSPFGRVADVLRSLPSRWMVATSQLYDHRATSEDPDEKDPTIRMGWRVLAPSRLPKIVAKYLPDLVIEQGNHGAVYDGGHTTKSGLLVTRHFPYRSVGQFIQKSRNGAEAYAAAGGQLPDSTGAHWRGYGRILQDQGEEALGDVFRTWFWVHDPRSREDMMYDPAPVQRG